jgi:hypothetical protein
MPRIRGESSTLLSLSSLRDHRTHHQASTAITESPLAICVTRTPKTLAFATEMRFALQYLRQASAVSG